MTARKICLFFLIIICFSLTGCLSANADLTIKDDGSVHYEEAIASIDLLQKVLEEHKNDIAKNNISAKVESYTDGNMRGYKIITDYASLYEYTQGLDDKNRPLGLQNKSVRAVKGWFFDAYYFDLVMRGSSDKDSSSDMKGLEQAMTSQIRCNFTLNLPYSADYHNADQVSNENKKLSWNLASTISTGEDKNIQAKFKIWHKAHVVITVIIIAIVFLLIIIFGILALVSKDSSARRNYGIVAGAGLFVAIILSGISLFMLFSEPNFSDKTIIAKSSIKQETSGAKSENTESVSNKKVTIDDFLNQKDNLDVGIGQLAADINVYLKGHTDFRGSDADQLIEKAKGILEKVENLKHEVNSASFSPEEEKIKPVLLNVIDCEAGRVRGLYKGMLDSRNNGDYQIGFKEGTSAAYKFDEENAKLKSLYKK